MNILITGGLGGVGQEIVRVLGALPDARIVTYGRSLPSSSAILPENCCHEQGSILDPVQLRGVVERHGITAVVHAAAARTRECEESLEIAREVNVTGTRRVLEAIDNIPSIEQFLFLSSAAVYGHIIHPVTENEPARPSSNYAITKLEAEQAAVTWSERTTVRLTIIRPGFIVGPLASGSLATFLKRIACGGPARLVFPGRFHLHGASDLARAVVTLLTPGDRELPDIFHLPGHDASLAQLKSAILEAREERIPPGMFEIETDPTPRLPEQLDWTRFNRIFGPVKLTPFADLIQETLRR